MSRARDMANLGAQAGSGLDASDITTGTLGNTVQDNITRLGTVTTGTFNGTIGGTTVYPSGSIRQIRMNTAESAKSATNSAVVNIFSESITTGSQNSKVLITFSGRAYTGSASTELYITFGTSSGGTDIDTFATLWDTDGGIAERFYCQYIYDMAQSTTTTIYVGVTSSNTNTVIVNPNNANDGKYVLTLQEIID